METRRTSARRTPSTGPSRRQKSSSRRCRLQGFSNDDIRRIIAEADTPQAAFDRLTELADPPRRCAPPPMPPYERELEPHEEQIFLEMLEGDHQPVTSVG